MDMHFRSNRHRFINKVPTLFTFGDSHYVYPMDWNIGTGIADSFIDVPPYGSYTHLRLQLGTFTSTSFGLIIRK